MKKLLLFISALIMGAASFAQCACNPSVTLSTIGIRSNNDSSGISHDGVLSLSNAKAGGPYTHTFTVAIPSSLSGTFGGFPYVVNPIDSVDFIPITFTNAPGLTYTGRNIHDTAQANSIYCFTVSGNLPSTINTSYKWYIKIIPHGIITIPAGPCSTTVPIGAIGSPCPPTPVNLYTTPIPPLDSIVIKVGTPIATPIITATITPTGDTLKSNISTQVDTTIQWYLNGTAIVGATTQTYIPIQNGAYTAVALIPTASSGISDTITISNFPPKPTITAAGHVLTSSDVTTGNQWYRDGAIIAGATSSSYTATQNGKYTVKVTVGGLSSLVSNAITIGDILSCTPDPSVTLATQGIKSDNGASGISADGILILPNSAAGGPYTHTFTVAIQNPTTGTRHVSIAGIDTSSPFVLSPVDSVRWNPVDNLPSGLTYTGGVMNNLTYGNTLYCFTITGNLPATTDITYKWYIKQTPYGTLNTGGTSCPAPTGTLTIAGFGSLPIDLTNSAVDSIMISIGPLKTDIASLNEKQFGVLQNAPNPFNGTTTIKFSTPTTENVQFTVVDILGRVVHSQTISASAGINTITYSSGSSDSGTYFYTISNSTNSITKKLVVYK